MIERKLRLVLGGRLFQHIGSLAAGIISGPGAKTIASTGFPNAPGVVTTIRIDIPTSGPAQRYTSNQREDDLPLHAAILSILRMSAIGRIHCLSGLAQSEVVSCLSCAQP